MTLNRERSVLVWEISTLKKDLQQMKENEELKNQTDYMEQNPSR
jgi:hypothetical protein